MGNLPTEVTEIVYDGKIPQEVAEIPQDLSSPEERPYVISFAKYNDDLCEISLLGGNKGRKAVETLKDIGTKVFDVTDFQRHSIDRIPVSYAGEYKKLFKGLSADVEIKEAKLQQNARIFYFDIEPEKTLYVVAIKENHFETDKVRR